MTTSGNPTDSPLMEVLADLAASGHGGQFRPVDGGTVQCLTCRESYPAPSLLVDATRRLEGESDPADMLLVVAARCARCGTGGTLVLSYGPESSPTDDDVSEALDL